MRTVSVIFLYLFLLSTLTHAGNRNKNDTLNHIDSDGLKQGQWITYGNNQLLPGYSPDQKVQEGYYVDGKKTGVWINYHPSGYIHQQVTYVNARPNGPVRIYYRSGILQESGDFNGTAWITSTHYFENGCLSQRHDRDGTTYYDVNSCDKMIGGFRYIRNASGDKTMKIGTGADGKDLDTLVFSSPIPDRQERKEPIPDEYVDPRDLNIYGAHKLYTRKKQILKEGIFSNNTLINGRWYKYNEKGHLVSIEIYRYGVYVGEALHDVPIVYNSKRSLKTLD